MTIYQAPTLYSELLPQCADSVESHPSIRGLFALATYQVDQAEVQREMSKGAGGGGRGRGRDDDGEEDESASSSPAYTRRGMVRLYSAAATSTSADAGADAGEGKGGCSLLHEEALPAVLDTKWTTARTPADADADADADSQGVLGIADATGCVSLRTLRATRGSHAHALTPLRTLRLNPSKALCLSLDWSDRLAHYPHYGPHTAQTHADPSLVVSQSDGTLAYVPSLAAALSDSEAHLPGWVRERERAAAEVEAEGESDSDSDSGSGSDSDSEADDEDDATPAPPSSWPLKPLGLETWQAHAHEAWTASFDAHSGGRVLWSGGDDLALRGWDVRTPLFSSASSPASSPHDGFSLSSRGLASSLASSLAPSSSSRTPTRHPTFTLTRPFSAGITSLAQHPSPARAHTWAVGSYDGILRLFDARHTARPTLQVALDLGADLPRGEAGAGVWRLKWHHEDPALLLAGCMHAGCAVVRVRVEGGEGGDGEDGEAAAAAGKGERWRAETRTTFSGHESIAYGCDWVRGGGDTVASCSFYDKKLCTWSAKVKDDDDDDDDDETVR